MIEVKRLIQLTLLALVLISSLLLGMSMESMRMIAIGVVGAVIGFIVTDWFKLFRIRGFLANVASIVILFLAMKDFFSEDGMGKLVSVANLLVYLQTVLMFQEKTPRLNWQILVLSLLQVVVAAIFSLNFEAGLLFLVYFVVVGLAMVLQSVHTDSFDINNRNRRSVQLWKTRNQLDLVDSAASNQTDASHQTTVEPLVFFEPPSRHDSTIRPLVYQLLMWIAVSAVFTSILFFLVPRHTAPWFGPTSVKVSSTGVSKSVDLDERGLIVQSNKLMFRVDFQYRDTGEPVSIVGNPPYFRGLALSNLVIEDGKTNWRAPHDRVFNDVYQSIPHAPFNQGRQICQKLALEESTDPLIYGLMPFYRSEGTPGELLFCHEVSALTRSRTHQSIGLAPFSYVAQTLVDEKGRFFEAWPYISNTKNYQQLPMSADPPQREWLTQMDPERYPSLVRLANRLERELAAELGDANSAEALPRIALLRSMENYFLKPGRFTYTLDFRKVKRNDDLDPIEDFVKNHRHGQCELFASALTVMLRNKNIPARLVVGFQGAKENTLSGSYMVRAKNAHAWVEAYLRPEDCTPEMVESGQAGPGGAWLRLDPTPETPESDDAGVGEEAIELARTAWDDYVLGMENQSGVNASAFSGPIINMLRNFDVLRWERRIDSASRIATKPVFKYLMGGLLLLVFFWTWLRGVLANKSSTPGKQKEPGRLRKLIAGAISLIAPKLGKWVREGATQNSSVQFYHRMAEILERHNLTRSPSQTHREFAGAVASAYDSHPDSGLISSTVHEITELFNEVRFGQEELQSDLASQIELSLNELDAALQLSSSHENSPRRGELL